MFIADPHLGKIGTGQHFPYRKPVIKTLNGSADRFSKCCDKSSYLFPGAFLRQILSQNCVNRSFKTIPHTRHSEP